MLETDVSGRGIGAVLKQSSTTKEDRPLAYFSKQLSLIQQCYTATEREALAVVTAMEHFSIYLIRRSFTLVTDHKTLTKIENMTNGNHRHVIWSLPLQKYPFTVQHRPGKSHLNADSLSK